MKPLGWSQHYLPILKHSRAANSIKGDGIWQKFKLIQAFMLVLEHWKNERLSAANSVVHDVILTKFKLIQAFVVVLVTCKKDEDPSKNEDTRVVTIFLPL